MKENKNLHQILKELDALKQAADDSECLINETQHRLAVFFTETAFELYPELKEMESAEILNFGGIVSRSTTKLALVIDNFVYQMAQKNNKEN